MKLLAWFRKPEPEVPPPPEFEYEKVAFDFSVLVEDGTWFGQQRTFSQPTESSRERHRQWCREQGEWTFYEGKSAQAQARRAVVRMLQLGGWVGDTFIPPRQIVRVRVELAEVGPLNPAPRQARSRWVLYEGTPLVQRPRAMHWTILLCAIILAGVSFIGGRMTAPDQPVVLDLDAAMAVGPPEGPGGRLDPDYRDLVISTLQHAVDSAERAGAAARIFPDVPPCRIDVDCPPTGAMP